MKQINKTMTRSIFILVLLLANVFSFAGNKEGYSLKFKVNGLRKDTVFLANYYGDKQYIQDTAITDANGVAIFEGKKNLEGGIYLFVLPKKKYFELIVSEQKFEMETDSTDFVKNMKIKGSIENQLFYEYLSFIQDKGKEADPLRRDIEKYKDKPEDKDKLKSAQDKLNVLDKEVKEYKLKFMADHKDSFVSKVFRASQEPEIPETPILPNGRKDSTFAYRYYKAHYFDYLDFSEGRLIRTPIYHNKIDTYIKKLTAQIPDSINASADILVKLASASKELKKYTIWYITNNYETSNIMGMDAVFVHMVKNYYSYTNTPWVDSVTMFKITDKAKKLDPILLGKKAPNVILKDSLGLVHNLYAVGTKYTILYFFDPDCGHCQKATPKLIEAYDRLKTKGCELFAVGSCTRDEYPKWKKFLRDYKMRGINVADPDYQSNFRYEYDLSSYPQVFILDKDKKIIAKKLGTEQIEDFIDKVNSNNKNKK